MTSLGDLRSQVLRLLGDPAGSGYEDTLILDGINAAFDAILPWTPKTAKSTITGDGTATAFLSPADCYEIEAVVKDSTGEVLPRTMLVASQKIGLMSLNSNDWIEYPDKYLSFSKAPSTGEIYSVYYLAHWTKFTTATDMTTLIEPPERSLIGITLYAAAYILLPAAVGASEVRQFATRIDSGTPEHNPMQRTALYLLELFQREMGRHPKHQKASK